LIYQVNIAEFNLTHKDRISVFLASTWLETYPATKTFNMMVIPTATPAKSPVYKQKDGHKGLITFSINGA